ncbi:hypothetical protein [Arthrobacter sp. A5]|uniref:hypothetical protein n=1 Tax=Arthrobacter sp. A5 TaxID=576926 RepID=UPI003DAA0084
MAQPDNASETFAVTLRLAREATARRSHAEAVDLWNDAISLLDNSAEVSQTALLLELARSRYRAGDTTGAWRTCCAVADVARSTADAAAMADAAAVMRGVADFALAAQIHDLCIVATLLLGGSDPVRLPRVRAQLAATGSAWVNTRYFELDDGLVSDAERGDPDAAFLTLDALQGVS